MMKGNPCAETTKLLPKCHMFLQLFDYGRDKITSGARLLHHTVPSKSKDLAAGFASGNRAGAPALGQCIGSASTQYRG
jgi:hypothetical protein